MKIFTILALVAFGYCDRMEDDQETCFQYVEEIQNMSSTERETMDSIILVFSAKFVSSTEAEQKRIRSDFMKNCLIGAVHHHYKYKRISKIMAEALLVSIEDDY